MRQKTTAPIRLLSILRNAMLSGSIDTSPTVPTTGVNSMIYGVNCATNAPYATSGDLRTNTHSDAQNAISASAST